MSVQFGECNFDGRPLDPSIMEHVRPLLEPYGPDGGGHLEKDGFVIIYREFQTLKGPGSGFRPHVSNTGCVFTWDGRLDNTADLLGELRTEDCDSEVSVVSAAYEKWGIDSLSKLIGDWALSIWDPRDRSLILAKDVIGSRPLYYCARGVSTRWCTILDPLLLLEDRSFAIDEEYVAGWLSFFPAVHLTPYPGIHSVPPSCFVRISKDSQTIRRYWNFDRNKRIRYQHDAPYEEHFRALLAQAVRRRLRSATPVLAELSGGLDSSSIVCIADNLVRDGSAEAPRLDTISFFDDSEPTWNERPFFTKVEQRRGRPGCHIELSDEDAFHFELDHGRFAATPAHGGLPTNASRRFADWIKTQGHRVVLSGIGGDEILGGVPTAIPELQDLLLRGHLFNLAHRMKSWALTNRKPLLHLFFEIVRGFLPEALFGKTSARAPASWIEPAIVSRNKRALSGYEHRLRIFGGLPSFQENLSTLDALRRQLTCSALPSDPPYEIRYPLLDRDLLEFLFGIPREQLVRPGQRRSLMRRALTGIVPDEILHRKRKAFVERAQTLAIARKWEYISDLARNSLAASMGFIDSNELLRVLSAIKSQQEHASPQLIRLYVLEAWLRQICPSAIQPSTSSARSPAYRQTAASFSFRSFLS